MYSLKKYIIIKKKRHNSCEKIVTIFLLQLLCINEKDLTLNRQIKKSPADFGQIKVRRDHGIKLNPQYKKCNKIELLHMSM